MVTEAGKELLRNTINTAKFHNRILEENEMWKQWEIERGLTMMVSDDLILSRTKKHHHQCSKHRKRSKSRSQDRTTKAERDFRAAGSSKTTDDRWDHSGFRELYPDEPVNEIYNSPNKRDTEKKWDHSGFLELYPEEAYREKHKSPTKSKDHSKKQKKKRKHHSKESTSDDEIWEEFKTYKRNKAAKKSKTLYDSHVKEWKKSSENAKKS